MDIFDVDESKHLFINEDKFILTIIKDKIDKEPVAFHSHKATIKLFCSDSFFYSKYIKIEESTNKNCKF